MSMHKEVKSKQEVEGLLLHGMPVGKASQLSDAFVLGMRYERKEDLSTYPVSEEDFGYYSALIMPFLMGEVQDLHNDLVSDGWAEKDATDFLERMRTLYHKHANEMLPFIRNITADDVPEERKVEFQCTASWMETRMPKRSVEVFIAHDLKEEFGDIIQKHLQDTMFSDLATAIQRSGQTLIPEDIHYGMVLEYVNKENPTLVGWRLAHMGKDGNTVLATSQGVYA